MDIAVPHPDFQQQKLTVRTTGFLKGPRLLVNGEPRPQTRNRYVVQNDAGAETKVQLKPQVADPIPALLINDEPFRIARPLTWYEYAWNGLPILLIFAGGGLGAFIGICATLASSRILRSDRSVAQRFGLTGLVTVAAVALFFLVVMAIRPLFSPDSR